MTRTWLSRRTLAAATLTATLALPLALSACGTPEAGSAAVVGDRRISVSDVQNGTADISSFYAPQPVAQEQVLFFLIAGPYIEQAAAGAGVGYSADDALTELKAKLATPTPAGVEVYRANQAISNIQKLAQTDANKAKEIVAGIRTELSKVKVTVNPRYGSFDPKDLNIVPDAQNWIVQTAAPSPSAEVPVDPSAPAAEPSPSAS